VPKLPSPPPASTKRAFSTVFAILVALAALPLLLFDFLPSQDAPNHFAIAATLASEGTSGWGLFFDSHSLFAPYGGFYALASGAASLVSPAIGTRLPVVAFAIAVPLASLYLVRAAGLSPWAALWSFLFIYGDPYLVGFLPYLLTLPLVLVMAGSTLHFCRSGRRRHLVAIATLGLVTFWIHPIGSALAAATSVILAATARPAMRRAQWLAASLVPTAAALIAFAIHSASGPSSWSLGLGFKLDYLLRTPFFLADSDTRLAAGVVVAALVLVVIAIGTLPRRHSKRADGTAPRPLVWVGAATCLLYLALPFKSGSTIWLDLRIAPIAWLFGGLVIAHRAAAWRLGRAALAAVALATSLHAIDLHRRFASEASALDTLIEQLEPQQRVLSINGGEPSKAIAPLYVRRGDIRYYSPYAHAASYYHLEKGGVSPLMTFHESLPWIPLRLQDGAHLANIGIADAFDGFRLTATLGERQSDFDYLIVHGASESTHRRILELAILATREGRFALYRTQRDK